MSDQLKRAAGKRLHWHDLPQAACAAIEERLGDRVVDSTTQLGGFSPGVASRLTLASGAHVFVKGVHPSGHVDSPGMHRREARIAASLPAQAPAPRLLWMLDEGDDGWVVLAFEDVDGRQPSLPWTDSDLRRVMDAMARMAGALTPSPVTAEPAEQWFAEECTGWHELAEAGASRLDEWSVRNLDRLCDLESKAPECAAGETLIHLDVRADNILMTQDQVYFVDWPHARIGAAWIDVVGMAPSVALEGGPEPEELFHMYPLASDAATDAVTAVVAAFAGFFTSRSLRPEPRNLPGLRAFQAAQGEVARLWVAKRTLLL